MGTRLLLVRHGETEWHAENRYAGTSEVGLTERGRRQAERLAAHLAAAEEQVTALYRSPQGRARVTAEPSARALGLEPVVVEELREVHFGIAEGRVLSELDPQVVAAFRADPVAGAFPGAEPTADAARRGAAALRAIAAREDGGRVLVVAHNTLIRVTLCELLGIPVRDYRRVFPRLENAAITEIGIDGDATSLRRFNLPTS
ncbi:MULTISPECIES: histidine phosphatase family protein [Amycolatopsis]|uniref:Histidine phosphatase family protein n=1 Tax=Amycolatopsis thermalba TaxID=944492 RepID=A0ABY4P5N3_9PSEU|nr:MULTISPECIES: histidine phosphatase family protein [Amycolatopsis]OXM72222.1 histidine phosphatase family protein [Amycolatopsis sp. KNN50.9b]UQS27591.1 histidine phosphatase family protein [Amycolatopsis thermalba]